MSGDRNRPLSETPIEPPIETKIETQSASWLERFRHIQPKSSARDHDPKFGIVYARGAGSRLWDMDGNDYIDLTCGYSATNFGHAFPPLVAAATRQLSQLTHLTGEAHIGRIELAERLVQLLGFDIATTKVLFNTTGARAIESAWKAAYAYRPGKLMTIGPCFHGRSIATQALGQPSGSLLPLAPTSQVIASAAENYPHCAACRLNLHFPSCQLRCVDSVFESIAQQAESISAVLVEPAAGARGYIFPPSEFFQQLRSVTAKRGILLIADEIQTGLGRCGSFTLSQRQAWRPDLIVLGKSLAGGIAPISVVVGRSQILDAIMPGAESETFAASPLATAVALEVLSQLESGPWMQRGAKLGEGLRRLATDALAVGYPERIPKVEGTGASCAIEFHDARRALLCAQACLKQRLLVHYTGPNLTRVVLLPALTMSHSEELDAHDRLQRALTYSFDV